MRYATAFVAGVLMVGTANAQFVAFSGKDSNPLDNFAFVAMTTIPNGTVFYISNRQWDNTTGSFLVDGEGTVQFTATAEIPKGTVTLITEFPTNDSETFAVQSDSGSGLGAGLGTAVLAAGSVAWTPTAADPHYAFAASNAADPTGSVTEFYALMSTLGGGFAASFDPRAGAGPASPNAIVVDFQTQTTLIDYIGDRTSATPATLGNAGNFVDGATVLPDPQTDLDTTFYSSAGLPVTVTAFEVD
jgi:hypothetical protein